jgi:hypothetical protein
MNATAPIDSNLSTERLPIDGRSEEFPLVHEIIVELNGPRSCWTVSSSSKSIAELSNVPGLCRPDDLLSPSIALPHFQQNAYLSSIIAPHS